MALALNSRKHRIFKLGFPLKFKRKGSELVIIDHLANEDTIRLEELDTFEIKSLDSDGFVLFDVSYAKPSVAVFGAGASRPQVEAGVNGYTLFHSSVPKSTSYGYIKSNYEYYKRNRDLSYYALIKKEGVEPAKIIIGSMFDPESRISQFIQIINRNFDTQQWFDRKTLCKFLPKPLQYGRIMKCVLDVLVAENFLDNDEAPPSSKTGKGRKREVFKKAKKLVQFLVNPRSFQKSTGVSVEQLPLTSD